MATTTPDALLNALNNAFNKLVEVQNTVVSVATEQGINTVTLTSNQTIAGVKTFEDSPQVPTPTAGDTSAKAASTQFVQNAIESNNSISHEVSGEVSYATSPTAPTPTAGDSSDKVATTEFVTRAITAAAIDPQSIADAAAVTLSDAVNSSSDATQGVAASPKAVKTAYDLADSKYTAKDATTSTKGIVQLSSSTSSTSTTLAATASAVKTAYDKADAAMPKSGGTYTGGVFGKSVALSDTAINLASGEVFTKTITADTTFTISGVPSSAASVFCLVLTNGGNFTVTWPSSIKWEDGSAPDLSTDGIDVLTFMTADGGTTWYGLRSIGKAA